MGNIHGGAINVDVLRARRLDVPWHGGARFSRRPTTPGSCRSCKRRGPTAACTSSTGTIGITVIRMPAAIPRASTASRGGSIACAIATRPAHRRFDLAAESDAQLIERLASPNVYFRDIAQRLLAERAAVWRRACGSKSWSPTLPLARTARMHALWALVGGGPLAVEFHQALLADADPGFRAWGVRAAGNIGASRCRDARQASCSLAPIRRPKCGCKWPSRHASRRRRRRCHCWSTCWPTAATTS